MDERVLGPNMKKLLARVVARKSIPPGGGMADAINIITTPGALLEVTRVSLDWTDQAIQAVRSAPDNPYGNDDILSELGS
jgi:hypothetical protein